MDMEKQMTQMAVEARQAARLMAKAPGTAKDDALEALAGLLDSRREDIKAANAKDLEAAEKRNLDAPRMDRLRMTDAVIDDMVEACREVAGQHDPVGEITSMWKRPNGLLVGRMRIPLGVILMIYESRPNVTVDAAILCLKAGNAMILRGGSEAVASNTMLAGMLAEACESAGLPAGAAQLVPTTDRAAVGTLLGLEEHIDVAIPRGGEGLIRAVVEQARMPVLKHYKGVCHAYVDRSADLEQALEIVHNGKVQRPGVCNALECLLVHKDMAAEFLPAVGKKLGDDGVEFRACPRSLPLLGPTAREAGPEDWGKEFHDLILAVKVVDSMDDSLEHIADHGSGHTEVIVSRDHDRAMRFLNEADASMVAVNASSRFNDGGQLGLGAEIGISTSKLHSYGPMGVTELTSTKFVLFGKGQIRV
jgi:glutamate-5-semialdehyde dehydrogenase